MELLLSPVRSTVLNVEHILISIMKLMRVRASMCIIVEKMLDANVLMKVSVVLSNPMVKVPPTTVSLCVIRSTLVSLTT